MNSDFASTKDEVATIVINTTGNLIFDFNNLGYICSVSIGLIAYFHKLLLNEGRMLKIINVDENIYDIIHRIIPGTMFNIELKKDREASKQI